MVLIQKAFDQMNKSLRNKTIDNANTGHEFSLISTKEDIISAVEDSKKSREISINLRNVIVGLEIRRQTILNYE